MRVLVVEDYYPIRRAVSKGLMESDFEVETASSGLEGLEKATTYPFDVIVLDLMLPQMSGLEVLKSVRERNLDSYIIILTAKNTVSDRIEGLNLGADDYLVKPFEFEELLARIRALVRRKYDNKNPKITIGDLVIDTTTRRVNRGGQVVELTAREYLLLEYLANRAGEVVSRTDIWEHVYDVYGSGYSNVVDVYIGYLRKKIEFPGLPKLIHTRRGHGYFIGVKSE